MDGYGLWEWSLGAVESEFDSCTHGAVKALEAPANIEQRVNLQQPLCRSLQQHWFLVIAEYEDETSLGSVVYRGFLPACTTQ